MLAELSRFTNTPFTCLPSLLLQYVGFAGSPQLVITNQAKPTTVIGLLVPFGHTLWPDGFVSTGITTSCGLFGCSRVLVPSALNWTIWSTVCQLVMRMFSPCDVGPALLPGLVLSVSPTDTGHTGVVPAISSE